MARQRRRTPGASYDKRPVPGSALPPPPTADRLTSREARALALRIDAGQGHYRTSAIRLLADRACGVVVMDTQTGTEHIVRTVQEWHRLAAD
jgi:hypothetical protein